MVSISAYKQLEKCFGQLQALREASGVLHWDAATMMPKSSASAAARGEQIAALDELCHNILNSNRTSDLLDDAENQNNLNNWQTVDISFTANSSDASSTNGLQLNMFKNYGNAYKIDDFRVTCTSCPHTSYQNGNWSSTSTWGGNGVPPASENTVVKHDVTADASTNNLGNLTVNSGKTLTISASQTVDVGGTFDATGATIDMNSSSRLELEGTVTNLGTLDELAGTVEYDGGTQNVLADAYYNLEIDQSGVKTSQGTVTAAGTLTVQSGATYAVAATSTTVTGTTDINGTLTASTGTFDANGAFDATNGSIDFTDAGKLQCAGTVTSLGTLDDAAGTVEYDGGTQTIFTDTYYNLEIDQSGTKSIVANIHTEGDLIITDGTLEMAGNNINCAGNFNNSGTLSSASNASLQLTKNCQLFSHTYQKGTGSFTVHESQTIGTAQYVPSSDLPAVRAFVVS